MAYRMSFRLGRAAQRWTNRSWLSTSANHWKIVQFVLSDIGEGIKEVTVRDWFVKVGDKVKQFEDVCLVESDKASVNITSRYDGVVTKLYHQEGDIALVGHPLVDIDELNDGSSSDEDAPVAEVEKPVAVPSGESWTSSSLSQSPPESKSLAAPAARRIAKENNIPLSEVRGTGKSGRVTKEDILNFMNEKEPKSKEDVVTSRGVSERPKQRSTVILDDRVVALTGIKKAMARTMTASHAIPSFGYSDELDVSKLVALRREIKSQSGETNLTYMPFFVKALSNALGEYPELNAHVDANCDNTIIKGEHNVGLAVDTPNGLLVPNIKGVQNMSVLEISAELNRLVEKSKNRTLTVQDLTGGTITISNIGAVGGTYVRPLINPPEVAIVGLGKFKKQPVFDANDQIAVAHICTASWSADHRVIDGATLARFSELWKHYVENPLKLLLEP